MNTQNDKLYRRIKSFVRREGKITPGQQRALEQAWPQFGCELSDSIAPQQQTQILEIGFGMGDSLLQLGKANPSMQFYGVEVYRPGVGSLLMKMQKEDVDNIRIYREDAIEVLEQSVRPQSLDAVLLFFPDPWHKKRHHKRRIVNDKFVELVLAALKPNGILHVATDWQHYAEYIKEFLQHHPALKAVAQNPLINRPKTKYEKRGERLGHDVFDLIYLKSSPCL